MQMFERTLIGGFSCVSTRLAFDSKILLPKDEDIKRQQKRKLIYKIINPETNVDEDKRFMSKILKMDENNQYGNGMTKPLPTGSIRRMKKILSNREFDLII